MKPQWKLDRELREHRRRLGLETNIEGEGERNAPINEQIGKNFKLKYDKIELMN